MVLFNRIIITFQEIYSNIDTNDDGEIDIKTVVEHIKAIEAGSGKNTWVNQRLQELLEEEREVDHVELEEFLVGFPCEEVLYGPLY